MSISQIRLIVLFKLCLNPDKMLQILISSGMDMKRVHRELAALMKSLHGQFDDQVKLRESTFEFDGDDVPVIQITICLNDGKIYIF